MMTISTSVISTKYLLAKLTENIQKTRMRIKPYQFRSVSNISLVGRVFVNGPGGLDSIPGRVIPKTLKMVLDISLLNTPQYEVRIKGKVEQSRERSTALPYTSV